MQNGSESILFSVPFDGMLNFDVDTSSTYLCLIQVNVFFSGTLII